MALYFMKNVSNYKINVYLKKNTNKLNMYCIHKCT